MLITFFIVKSPLFTFSIIYKKIQIILSIFSNVLQIISLEDIMEYSVKIYSKFEGEIENFLKLYFNETITLEDKHFWKKIFETPVELINICTTFIDNKEKFKANMWISLDKDVYIEISESNINQLVKYIYERFPY